MGDLYERIVELCKKKGVSPSRMCLEIGTSKSLITELKAGRSKNLSAKNAKKIADYLGVTMDYLVRGTGASDKKAPAPEGERPITFDDFTYAMFEEGKELTEMDKQILLSMARQLNDARKQKDGESG